jgi:hypothetical protein
MSQHELIENSLLREGGADFAGVGNDGSAMGATLTLPPHDALVLLRDDG